jgi:two-component system sensor histidine kinase DesK
VTGDGGGRVPLAPRPAWVFPAAFLGLLLPARASTAIALGTGAAGVAMTAVLFALPVLYTIPRGRALWDRYPRWLLSTQAVLTYLPFLMFGQKWAVGLSGLLGGLLLLTLSARVSWILLAVIVAVEGVLRLGVLGVYPEGGAQFISFVFVVPIDMALPLFGLVRLSDLVADLRAARTELAGVAVTQERLWATERLHAAIGGRLEVVSARATAARAVLADGADQARAHLTKAAGIARQAVEQVRETVTAHPDDRREPPPGHTASTVAPRLALLVLIVDLGAFAGHHLLIVTDEFAGRAAEAAGAGVVAAIIALQLYHSLAGRAGARPRAWRVTLTVQILLPLAVIAATMRARGSSLVGMVGFPAGSVLLLLPGRWAWSAFAGVTASVGVPRALLYPEDLDAGLYFMALVASTGLAVYGLSRLTDLAEELEATRHELARAAVDRERLRVAQDTHDLLGLGLSAIALKCDLARKLIGRDGPRARDELDALVRLAAQARAEIQAVTGGEHDLSLRAELAAAREVLGSAGVEVEVRPETSNQPIPPQVDAVLATVLREAVTNVLRHARATRCEIELIAASDAVSLRVANDGIVGEPPDPGRQREPGRRAGGRGLVNLAGRAAARGGRLTAHTEGIQFVLTVQVPFPAAASVRPGAEEALTAGDPPHRGDEIVGGAVLEEDT